MHQKAAQTQAQLRDQFVLLQTLQSLEVYQEFCYQLYLFFSYTYNPLTNHLNNKSVTYHYGAGGQRYLKETSDGKQTYYLGKAYEEEIEGDEITQRCYLSLGAKTIGVHETKIDNQYSENPSNPHYKTVSNKYFHSDALGSITTITNDSGEVIERRSYEPFGKIRAMDYGLTSNHAIIPTNTVAQSTRAFTGHEQIAELSGLIHMNARVYDSDIGRFLSADTTIQDPHDSQSYNRYSYVRNNPLKYTDPTGHSWWLKHGRSILIGVTVAVLTAVTGGLALGATSLMTASFSQLVFAGAVGGFVGGFASGVLQGATVHQSLKMGAKGALYGAIGAGTANIIGGIGSSVVRASLHGLTRAAITRAQGGKFSAGFWSGLASSALGGQIGRFKSLEGQTAVAAIVGGTASELGGGKFANGAVSAAFVHMYNYDAHLFNTKMPTPAEMRQTEAMLAEDGLIDVSGLFMGVISAPFRLLGSFGETLFGSRLFGVGSHLFGHSAVKQGVLNVAGKPLKIGWSGTGKYGGGMYMRVGVGTNKAIPKFADMHFKVPGTFVPNVKSNPIIKNLMNP